ncbi:hypothetical protein NM208_g5203 [Fusarium decemcellulare]|uniref:Uncharacterized protein n=2 Tax=Fusarium decemcellulare TaxID=57161 RepID=A0ACC1RYD6_9HYPO|nr:hypothetical protein NM208_g10298 [Fusarium decemcellulare]KAJ3540112.1 hypothetical protein NM208_g5203 [Fusarium decemcellulare]
MSDSTEPAAKRRRALTDARRESNRRAQRAWRMRQKENREKAKQAQAQSCRTRQLRPLLKACDIAPKPSTSVANNEIASGSAILSTQTNQSSQAELDKVTQDKSSVEPDVSPLDSATVELVDQNELTDDSPQAQGPDTQTIKSGTNPCTSSPKDDEPLLPDIYVNLFQLSPTTLCSALVENARSLGFDLRMFGNCGPEFVSPFYEPNISSTLDPKTLLQSSTASITAFSDSTIPIHLRPTLAQILIPHHISLDLIPLPFLRERAIMLSAAMPHIFNTWELKLDIYVHGGLTIWREGQSKKRRNSTSYQPWDMKSWEASPWFLKKWAMVIGGEDSEFHKQSIGWQVVRDVISSQTALLEAARP